MVEFLLEHNGTTYSGIYRVDDELAVTVTIAGKECRTPLVEMRPAAEAIAVARKMLDGGAASVSPGCSTPGEPAGGNRNLETARTFAS